MRRLVPVAAVALSLLVVLAACEVVSPARGRVAIIASASPICPVETIPPQPECAARPVPGATVRIERADGGGVVAEGRTDADGRLTLEVPAGDHIVVASEVDGLMAAPPPLPISVPDGQLVVANLAYDTGIR